MFEIDKIINTVINGDALSVLKQIPDESIDCVVTSPPYYALRSYKVPDIIFDGAEGCEHDFGDIIKYSKFDGRSEELKRSQGGSVGNTVKSENFAQGNSGQFCSKCGAWKGQLGLEPTPQIYIQHLLQIFLEVQRVLKKTGSCWVNIADSYAGSGCGTNDYRPEASKSIQGVGKGSALYKTGGLTQRMQNAKSLIGIPEMFVLGMQNNKWIRRNTIIWHKPSCLPSSAKDRLTNDFEYFYFFTKNTKYYFEQQFEQLQDSSIQRAKYGSRSKKASKATCAGYDLENQRKAFDKFLDENNQGRNKRTVWSICTKPTDAAPCSLPITTR
jgi:site-specific DNA-methyltransferase (adenine-specific)